MTQANNPLHGIKLEQLLNDLVDHYGWDELGVRINIRCFNHDPSIKSSLKFLRKTPWAREKVEHLYLKMNHLPLPKPKTAIAERSTPPANNKSEPSENGVNAHIWGKE
ncbi:VF530 family protein [Shewanella sp. AS1]|uniref:VF530 family protein n=1 Tax=Shewanella sp. AS1 TaxID=2907626 RepID=UPI001F2825BF|nr:VF530 family protein [Shewanella sp. AS1]MCE9678297.1 VF530 family protein [Shewanella sp. AS1]